VIVSVLRTVARRLVKTGNPSACATVNWKVCKSAIALYCLYFSVIKRECVTEVLINPIIRTRTRHSRHSYQPTHDILVSEVGGSDRIGFFSSGHDLKYVTIWCH
jgi:hypothetical protein